MNPVTALQMLQSIDTELWMALNNGSLVVGEKVDPIDREHVEKAAVLVHTLLASQRATV